MAQVARAGAGGAPAHAARTCSHCWTPWSPPIARRLRAMARAFAPTVATGDMLRFARDAPAREALAKAVERADRRCRCPSAPRRCASCTRRWRSAASAPASRARTPTARVSWACCRRRSGAPTRRFCSRPAALDAALAALDAGTSHRQAILLRRHGARDRGGRTAHRAAGRPAARHLPAASTARCRCRRSTWCSTTADTSAAAVRPARDRASALPTTSRNSAEGLRQAPARQRVRDARAQRGRQHRTRRDDRQSHQAHESHRGPGQFDRRPRQ